jgi:antitoxin HigA-1
MRARKRAPIHPGRILLKDYIEPLDLTITSIAKMLGVSRKAVSAIVNERKSITPEMALRLSRAFSTTPELWLNLQKNYDLWHAARENKGWEKVKPISIEVCTTAC